MDVKNDTLNDKIKQFWLSRQYRIANDSIEASEKTDDRRNLLYINQQNFINGSISPSVFSCLNKQLMLDYTATTEDEENFYQKITTVLKDFPTINKRQDWVTTFNCEIQPTCVQNALSSKEFDSNDLKIFFSQREQRKTLSQVKEFPKDSNINYPESRKSKCDTELNLQERKISLFSVYEPQIKSQQENIKFRGKRKLKEEHCKLEKESADPAGDGNQFSSKSPFLTAREQLVVEQRKAGKYNKGSISSSCYGNLKKSLGTRRGVSNRFIPPVNDVIDDKKAYNNGKDSGSLNPKYEGFDRMKNIEPKMVELIENEIMESGPGIDWDDIAGLDFAKATIQEIVIWPMLRPDIFTGLRGPPKGLLLFGPPGTGKTLIGKCIASQSNATFFTISASSLTSKWIGEGEKMVRALFGVARCHQPAVIFIDEIDSLLTQRSDGEHESSRRIKTEFLVQLDGATCSAEDRILIVGATNRPQELDEAARRRLVKRLYIPLPDGKARKQIVENLMQKQPNTLISENMDTVMEKTNGFSGADMSNLCREAALGPIRSIGDIRKISASDVRPVSLEDFENALKVVRPSVSQNDLQVYLDWNQQYGSSC